MEGRNVNVSGSEGVGRARIDTKNLQNKTYSSGELVSLIGNLNSAIIDSTIISYKILNVIIGSRQSKSTSRTIKRERSSRTSTSSKLNTKSSICFKTIDFRSASYVSKSNSNFILFYDLDSGSSNSSSARSFDFTFAARFCPYNIKVN